MSVIVAKKNKDGIIVGCDSMVTRGQMRDKTTKIFRCKNNNEVICGVVGSFRDLNILSVMDNILDGTDIRRDILDNESIISKTIPVIKEKLKSEGRVFADKESGECMLSSFIIVYKNNGWIIDSDFSVKEINDFVAIGSPSNMAIVAYDTINDISTLNDEQKIIKVIDACIKNTIYVDYPIVITASNDENGELKTINKEDLKDYGF